MEKLISCGIFPLLRKLTRVPAASACLCGGCVCVCVCVCAYVAAVSDEELLVRFQLKSAYFIACVVS